VRFYLFTRANGTTWSRTGAVHGPPGSGGARGVPTQFNLLPLGGAGFLARDHLVRRGARRAAVLAVPARVATVARVVKNHLSAALALPFVSLGEDVAAARRAVSYANLTQRTGFVEGGQHRGLRHSGRKAQDELLAQEMGIAWAGVRFSHLAGLAGRCRAEAGGALERESKDEHASEHYL